jgi:hypothetical protein
MESAGTRPKDRQINGGSHEHLFLLTGNVKFSKKIKIYLNNT